MLDATPSIAIINAIAATGYPSAQVRAICGPPSESNDEKRGISIIHIVKYFLAKMLYGCIASRGVNNGFPLPNMAKLEIFS
jgi:hypothetical protein